MVQYSIVHYIAVHDSAVKCSIVQCRVSNAVQCKKQLRDDYFDIGATFAHVMRFSVSRMRDLKRKKTKKKLSNV